MPHPPKGFNESRRRMIKKILDEMTPEEYERIDKKAKKEVEKIKADIKAKMPAVCSTKDGY